MKNTIKVQRAMKDLTQDDLAKKIGVSRQTIVNYEKGDTIPKAKIALLSKILDEDKIVFDNGNDEEVLDDLNEEHVNEENIEDDEVETSKNNDSISYKIKSGIKSSFLFISLYEILIFSSPF